MSDYFRGASNITVDNKGRVAIPSRYRDVLNTLCKGMLILTADRSGCILVYPQNEWHPIEKQLLKLPAFNKQARFLQRLMVGYATECEIDSQGRILLPTPLREHAHIKKQSLLIGQGKKFELWDVKKWSEECHSQANEEDNGQELNDALSEVRL